MKRCGLFLMAVMVSAACFAQGKRTDKSLIKDKDTLPYLKYPVLPSFNLLMQDSATILNTYNIKKGKPTVLIYFSPDCDHCKKMTAELLSKMDSMKDAVFYFFTPMPLYELKEFAAKRGLNNYKNIIVGRDYQYFFGAYYGSRYVPYVVVYDREKKLVKLYEGTVKMPDLIALLDKL